MTWSREEIAQRAAQEIEVVFDPPDDRRIVVFVNVENAGFGHHRRAATSRLAGRRISVAGETMGNRNSSRNEKNVFLLHLAGPLRRAKPSAIGLIRPMCPISFAGLWREPPLYLAPETKRWASESLWP